MLRGKTRNARWLLDELPELLEAGVLDASAAERLRAHYSALTGRDARGAARLLIPLFAILGAALVGGGLVLIVAHNWDQLPRAVKLSLALAPLVLTQGLAGWVVFGRPESSAWREGVGTAWSLALAAALALVDQIYHLGGGIEEFLLRWLLLGLPILYLLGATLPALFTAVGAAIWVHAEGWSAGSSAPVTYWLLIGSLLPFAWWLYRRHRSHPRTLTLSWTLALTLTVVPAVVFRQLFDESWIVLAPLLFAALYLLGNRLEPEDGIWRRPLQSVGALGLVVYSLILSYEWGWEDVSRGDVAFAASWSPAVVSELAVALLLLAVAGTAGGRDAPRSLRAAVWCGAPLVLGASYLTAGLGGEPLLAMILVNLYLLALGVSRLVLGVREESLAGTNGGLLILAAVIVARFFDADVEFVLRGLTFIALGIAFFAANYFLVRKRGTAS